MMPELITRNITGLAQEVLTESPITVISGARQTGKSTLMRQLLELRDARVLNLDSTIDREAAIADPDGFVNQYPEGTLAIDEVQRAPQLLLAMKNSLESDRRPGRFLITGSSNLLSLQGAEESLAGRAQTIVLGGLSQGELRGKVEDFATFLWNLSTSALPGDDDEFTRRSYLELVVQSSYPELHGASERSRNRWLRNYLERVLSKDVVESSGIQFPDRLFPLLSVLAAENASEFVAARFAKILDIPARSIPAYFAALQNVFLVERLAAWGTNSTTRSVSRAKTVTRDSGVAAYLAGADAAGLEHNISGALVGGLIEGFVAAELLKQQSWSTVDFTLNHFRDTQGREVDLVLENRRREISGIEVKASTSISRSDFKGLEYLRERAGSRFICGVVLHTGRRSVQFGDRLFALPISSLWRH